MRLDRERDRGNIGEDTDIVNDGEYMGYAEVTYGPWTIEYQRAREGGQYVLSAPERVTVKGPFMDDDMNGGEHRNMEVTIGLWSTITGAIDTWDYVEAAEDETYSVDE